MEMEADTWRRDELGIQREWSEASTWDWAESGGGWEAEVTSISKHETTKNARRQHCGCDETYLPSYWCYTYYTAASCVLYSEAWHAGFALRQHCSIVRVARSFTLFHITLATAFLVVVGYYCCREGLGSRRQVVCLVWFLPGKAASHLPGVCLSRREGRVVHTAELLRVYRI